MALTLRYQGSVNPMHEALTNVHTQGRGRVFPSQSCFSCERKLDRDSRYESEGIQTARTPAIPLSWWRPVILSCNRAVCTAFVVLSSFHLGVMLMRSRIDLLFNARPTLCIVILSCNCLATWRGCPAVILSELLH